MNPSTPSIKIRQIASILGALSVILGAFGAHALKAQLSVPALENWKTAVHYQFVHVLALLLLATFPTTTLIRLSAWFFGLGILFFSGSLYLISLSQLWSLNTAFIGPITPLGGFLFILGWLSLFFSALKKN